ncbi:uncharacterized protein GGS22DRAFT_185153 [Annulohypoxylon maeteangense]|uniref:uncharacterized protein n=1 Tax=Annulohypoxylon maeteangense TaxID=1927788 RepID=UPI002008DE10|nr:uncharacterized protein GGS22DRAFT_185153 [Annulohypoxylon maeteangense]KAI0887774.1 hypothetical protein GGS22DRAFT_185153 [Annulohypoxylon maeteangense]
MVFRNWQKTKTALPDVDLEAVPNHPAADGWVGTDGRFMCECGSAMTNDSHCISSHLTKVHKPTSAYQKSSLKVDGITWACPDCESRHVTWHALLAHFRRHPHGFRGDSSDLKEQNDPYRPESSLDAAFKAFVSRENQKLELVKDGNGFVVTAPEGTG